MAEPSGSTGIGQFLERLGLGEYTAAFVANHVDTELLASLNADDLRDLGVASVGHRRRILDAAASLRQPARAGADPGQRRLLTVMFTDIVGSSALATRLDPEEVREVIRRYQDACTRIAQRHGGTVARFVGDGVLYYFGYPIAQEDHATRAVRCALELVAAIAALPQAHGEPIQVRAGVASGLVVVGDIVSDASRETDAIVGETPNLAARLQSFAEPNGVVVAESTRRLCGDAIEFASAGAQLFKGAAGPVATFHALRATERKSFEPPLRILVGRDAEYDRLESWRSLAAAGSGQAVRLVGEPGMGKSTLVARLQRRSLDMGAALIRLQCSSYHQDSPLQPLIDALVRSAGLRPEDDAQARWRKLVAFLSERRIAEPHSAASLAQLLGIAVPVGVPTRAAASARQRRDQLFQLLRQLFLSLAAERFVLLVAEDLHWADRSTLDFIEMLLEDVPRSRLLLAATHRPEFSPGWNSTTRVRALELRRLSRDESLALLTQRLGDRVVSSAVLGALVERADGVPLFIEELAKSLLEAPAATQAALARGDIADSVRAIPESLHGLLAARLDRLGETKEVAQIAATIGRTFGLPILAAVWGRGEERSRAAVAALLQAGIFVKLGTGAVDEYRFHHALIRDAAYEMLLKSRRRALHGQVAASLQRIAPQVAESNPEILARHFGEAGMPREALPLWRTAGQRAAERWADVEAASHYRAALAAIADGAADPVDDDTAFDTLLEAVRPMVAAAGYGAPEVVSTMERAATMAQRIKDPRRLFPMLFHQWIGLLVAGEIDAAHALGERFARLSSQSGGETEQLLLLRMNGSTRMFRGELAAARSELAAFMERYDPARHGAGLRHYGTTEHAVTVACCLTAICALQGNREEARRWRERALADARAIGHAHSIAHALAFSACLLGALLGEGQYLEAKARELIALAEETSLPYWQAMGRFYLGCASALEASDRGGVEQARAVLDGLSAAGARFLVPTLRALLGSVAARRDPNAAAGFGLEVSPAGGERWMEAERLRVCALLAGARGDPAACLRTAAEAREIARAQGAQLLEERAVRLLRDAEASPPGADRGR